jgi:hypothetical protein
MSLRPVSTGLPHKLGASASGSTLAALEDLDSAFRPIVGALPSDTGSTGMDNVAPHPEQNWAPIAFSH